MLIKQNWFFDCFNIVIFGLCTSSSIYSEETINVIVIGAVEMLLNGIAIVFYHSHETLVLVFIVGKLIPDAFCFFTHLFA